MKERPILFSCPMVRAILAGTKTQTRRAMKPQPSDEFCPEVGPYCPTLVDPRTGEAFHGEERFGASDLDECHPCPYSQLGDRLWVREAFQVLRETCSYEIGEYDVFEWEADLYGDPQTHLLNDCPRGGHRAVIAYRADYEESFEGPWRPSIYMPRWASRITLEIAAVRVERLQDISEADAIAEGIERVAQLGILRASGWRNYVFKTAHPSPGVTPTNEEHRIVGYMNPTDSYRSLWQSINGPGSWDANPWVWVIEFKRIQPTSEEGVK